MLTWSRDFQTTTGGTLAEGNLKWFVDGQLNACYNCVDRHALQSPDRLAIIFEADEVGHGRKITYGQLLDQVCKMAWVLKQAGMKKGDTAAIYMPMVPEALIAILACARLGVIHSVVFAGFSSSALRDRILDANCKVVITADESTRGGKVIALKPIVDAALQACPLVSKVIVYQRTGAVVNMTKGRDVWWHEEVKKWPSYLPPEPMSAEDPLFLLYTSGSTGKPKGLMHTTAGYLVGAAVTTKYVFDVHDGDRFFCGGDVGWITGHTYLVYGPLLLGVSIVVFEGTLAYPNNSRYWDIIQTHKVTQLHSAPTALRMLKRAGDECVRGDLSSLRSLGCVGEPIAAEVWKWCHHVVGKGRVNIVDVRMPPNVCPCCSSADLTNRERLDVLPNGNRFQCSDAPCRHNADKTRKRHLAFLRH
jgi:acetyl-CoA synthetase